MDKKAVATVPALHRNRAACLRCAGLQCSLRGFSRGAFWASDFALHIPRLFKFALLGYYPEPGEDGMQSQLHGSKLQMPTFFVTSTAERLSLASKAEPFALGLQSRAQGLNRIVRCLSGALHCGRHGQP